LDLSIDRGDIEVRPVGVQMGTIEVKTRSGDIDLVLPANAKFDLTAVTERGDVTNDYGAPLRVDAGSGEDKGGRIVGAVGSGPRITATTRRGLISVRKGVASTTLPAPRRMSEDAGMTQPPAPPKPPKIPKTLQPMEQ
jgi:hypothetical protein